MSIHGNCHCGNISFELAEERLVDEIPARTCSCTFCVNHGASWTSNANAKLTIAIADPDRLSKYTFGTHTAVFGICATCGAVPFVTSDVDGQLYGAVNVNAFAPADQLRVRRFGAAVDEEDGNARLARRRLSWIADVRFVQPPASPHTGVDLPFEIRHLRPNDVALMKSLLTMFGEAFDDIDAYGSNQPSTTYLRGLLGGDTFIALAAMKSGSVVGGIAAYELKKFEQPRSEVYIYDLAVLDGHRREGIATALIEELKKVAATRDAYVIFVQADKGVEDEPAIALYEKLGTREDVFHFDIPVAEEV